MFLEHQISILERFLKSHVTLKTGVKVLRIQHFKIYSNNKHILNVTTFKMIKIFHNNTASTVFYF